MATGKKQFVVHVVKDAETGKAVADALTAHFARRDDGCTFGVASSNGYTSLCVDATSDRAVPKERQRDMTAFASGFLAGIRREPAGPSREDAERVADAVAEALGVDTGTVHENRFGEAVDRAMAEMSRGPDPFDGTDLRRPEGLSARGEEAWRAVTSFLSERGLTQTGGCRAFYSPEEWRKRGEKYGVNSELVIVYDGGDVRAVCGMGRGPVDDRLKALGLYIEECTGWYSAVYPV